MLRKPYVEWLDTKRKFTEEELLKGTWLKEGHGRTFRVEFKPRRCMVEREISNPNESWEGSWEIEEGILRTRVGPYELDIIANKTGNVHSGIEVKGNERQAYFKLRPYQTRELEILFKFKMSSNITGMFLLGLKSLEMDPLSLVVLLELMGER